MRNISDTIARLTAARGFVLPGNGSKQTSRLSEMSHFGSNPGALKARTYLPSGLSEGAPLVVVLHGCTQTAAGYDHGSGWSQLADRHGFALLFPEQQRSNNPNLCFNWFVPDDIRRGSGEALSIRQMVQAMIVAHGLDSGRVFITGLSAGGAMTSVMLATYPEVFAGGAIIAGLPYGCAASVPEALDRMRGHGLPTEGKLQSLLQEASGHDGPWPAISVWHGTGDRTVAAANMDAIVAQWRGVHGLQAAPTQAGTADGYPRRVWCDRSGAAKIEEFSITGMAHGTPVNPRDGIGASGAFMLDAKISSTRHIADFWRLTGARTETALMLEGRSLTVAPSRRDREPISPPVPPRPAQLAKGVGKVIEDALRAAGLMR
jgi:poly(hydroxyalkanoate) depolymerase family esterase